MKIKVTQQDIEKGVKYDEENCPIALAVKKTYTHDRIAVHAGCVFINENLERLKFPLPEKARQFVEDFDEEKEVEEFEFDLEF